MYKRKKTKNLCNNNNKPNHHYIYSETWLGQHHAVGLQNQNCSNLTSYPKSKVLNGMKTNILEWPSQSSEPNPKENLWGYMERLIEI